jgi:D-xylose transport system substrate-binding protein
MRFAKFIPMLGVVGIVAVACGGGGGTATNSPAVVPADLSISSFTQDFSYMPKLKDLVGAGKGMVGVILPDTTSSTRYVAFDQPYLTQAFTGAGYSSSHLMLL